MKQSDISDSLLVRKCGVRHAKIFGRLWFAFMYVFLTAVAAASWVLAPELATSRGARILVGCFFSIVVVLAASLLTRISGKFFGEIADLEARVKAHLQGESLES
jgi:hypothetical protein